MLFAKVFALHANAIKTFAKLFCVILKHKNVQITFVSPSKMTTEKEREGKRDKKLVTT